MSDTLVDIDGQPIECAYCGAPATNIVATSDSNSLLLFLCEYLNCEIALLWEYEGLIRLLADINAIDNQDLD